VTVYRSVSADGIFNWLSGGAAVLVALIALLVLGDVALSGAGKLSWSFLAGASEDAGRAGGILPILVSTALLLAVCMAAVLPVGLATSIVLAELAWRAPLAAGAIRHSLDVLAGIPSIVFGLFGNAFFCRWLDLGFSLVSGGLTLACMVLPVFIRLGEEGLRAVPVAYRYNAAALGLTWRATLVHVLLPGARPGLVAGFVLGVGRALAETAALVFTSGYVDRMPGSLLDSGRALSLHVYDLAMNVPGGDQAAYSSALVLVVLLFLINGFAAYAARRRR
jgi:phosphate transport system permease protein